MSKPIIRHCRNCEYAELRCTGSIDCTVKYVLLCLSWQQRIKALLCRYYRAKAVEIDQFNRVGFDTVKEEKE